MPKTPLAAWFDLPGTPRQSEFARTIGISKTYLSQIVAGQREPSLSVAHRISQGTAGAVPVIAMIIAEAAP